MLNEITRVLDGSSSTLVNFGSTLHAAFSTLFNLCSTLFNLCSTLHELCSTLHAADSTLINSSSTLDAPVLRQTTARGPLCARISAIFFGRARRATRNRRGI